ncbi:electron transfer flavoprotein subunit alpha/FixB family protein [Kineococcus rhizosphaerae]|uniref:Electron transfer flavoprotein alpha subunit apoprotein n=1 Tax=Kineococcus rhizosphaerae TaxID=559628 RepID=A0A2T0R587_9ACTN|nr:electron transfer flavoprotein subunit alpha/FixB family protein [Kineococcus rhizosphaerae]PRY15919.1 electron transfer flavoprotein alpha subunit apoprotein [Kineococcus rhizosphaerae]
MSIAVLVDHTDGHVRSTSLELLTLARQLASTTGLPVHAVWTGADPQAEVVAAHGADALHVVRVEGADEHLTTSVVDGLQTVLTALGDVSLLLVASTFEGKEVAARLAVRTGAGVVTGASGVELADGHWTARKTVLAGTWDTACAAASSLAVVALAPHAVQAAPLAVPAETRLVEHAVQASAAARAVSVVSREPRPRSERPALAEAEVVVVGGRGVEGDFSGVEELADVLGAAVGATRVATDEGWIGHEAQVGQTGVTISPRLYVGAGVSGAVHHKGGMAAAQTIVAINNDPDAPIFEFADYGVVGDLTEVLPALTAALRARRG